MAAEINGAVRQPPRLLDRVREANRLRHGSRSTEKSYVAWIRRYVLHHDLPWLEDVVRARPSKHLPVVLTRDEVKAVISRLDGTRTYRTMPTRYSSVVAAYARLRRSELWKMRSRARS